MPKSARRTVAAKDRAIAAARHLGVGRETEYRVEGNDGLVLAVLASAAGDVAAKRVWRCYYSARRPDGGRQQRKQRLGNYPAVSLAEARRQALDLMSEVKRGHDPVADEKRRAVDRARSALSFSEMVADHLAEQARSGVSSVTIAQIERALAVDALPALGKREPRTITAAETEAAVDAVRDRGSPGMARHLVKHIKHAFNGILDSAQLAAKYRLEHNPATRVGRARRGQGGRYGRYTPRARYLTDEEIVCFLAALRSSRLDPLTVTVIRILVLTGQRRGEVLGAQPNELHLAVANPKWVIPASRTKNRRVHVVPLAPDCVDLFGGAMRITGHADWVFASHGAAAGVVDGHSIQRATRRLVTRSGLEHFTPHDLRRTVATGMRRIGVPADVVSQVLNHTRQDITGKVYDHHVAEPEKRDALERWALHVAALEAGQL
ncbi:MAG: tyrosine-type recombinase/integrase [Hyphomicrobium aestuarii]|nr:tyrosine-type recombinase/integrase [Hyphomicrobium aestuarii]